MVQFLATLAMSGRAANDWAGLWGEGQREAGLPRARKVGGELVPGRRWMGGGRVKVAGCVRPHGAEGVADGVRCFVGLGCEASPMRVPKRRWVQDAPPCFSHRSLSGGRPARPRGLRSRRGLGLQFPSIRDAGSLPAVKASRVYCVPGSRKSRGNLDNPGKRARHNGSV